MANIELGKKIWENIKFSNYYAEDFEQWYKDCFAECMNEATNYILNGSCDFERGSFVEISKNLSKSGRTIEINVDKEDFIEFYGEEGCKDLFYPED